MAITDFLLQANTAPRVQPGATQTSAQQRAASAPEHSFSSVYAQQRAAKPEQSQQRDAAPTRHNASTQATTIKNSAANATEKSDTKAAVKNTADAKKSTSDSTASSIGEDVDEGALTLAEQEALLASQEQGEAEAVEVDEDDILDPLLLMAMAATPTQYNTQTESVEGQAPVLLGRIHTGFTLHSDSVAADELALDADEALVLLKPDAEAETVEGDEPSMLLNASGKALEGLSEKTNADKNSSAAVLDSVKAAPDTLLNAKAVTPTDSIRADLQPPPESQLSAQAVRQVPGAAIAMQQPGWTQDVTDKVMWMSAQNLKSAEIKLDPAELGRLDIKIDMTQEQTQVSFSSAHAGVRESLESQMHRLRELFAQQGLHNVDVDVSDQSQHNAQTQEQVAAQDRGGERFADDQDVQTHVTSIDTQQDGRLGRVDYYA